MTGQRNCSHSERIVVGVDILDGEDGRPVVVHKRMRCTACGDVKAADVLLEEERAERTKPTNCPHWPNGGGPPGRCRICIDEAQASKLPPGITPTNCPLCWTRRTRKLPDVTWWQLLIDHLGGFHR